MLAALVLACAGCDAGPEPASPATSPAVITVASMSPAFTDLILAMHAGDRLVAVSNFEPPRESTDSLPRVGDYRTVDWEKLAKIRPGLILTQYGHGKMPDGLVDRAARIGARVLNMDIDTLDDVNQAIREIGAALALSEQAEHAAGRFSAELQAVRQLVAARPRVRAVVVVGAGGLSVVGPGNFVDELLTIAGGENAITSGPDFANIDREKLIELDPPVIIQLMPGATPQLQAQADQFWREMGRLRAVRDGRVHAISDDDALLPATNAARIARRMAEALHEP